MKTDYKVNEYVANTLVEEFPNKIIAAEAVKEENYWVDDIRFTASTLFNQLSMWQLENKTLKGGFKFKEDGEFRDYFTRDIWEKLKFETDTTSGTPVYFVNAEDKFGNMENGKWHKLIQSNACLSFIAKDGIIIFSPKKLQDAFVGYAYYMVKHTTDFGKKGNRHWEKKAVIRLDCGTFIPCNPPDEFFKKNNN